jgi:hypothetical protein
MVEFAGKRALPLTGKSQAAAAADAVDPGADGRTLALELPIRPSPKPRRSTPAIITTSANKW